MCMQLHAYKLRVLSEGQSAGCTAIIVGSRVAVNEHATGWWHG